jgi:hypothetical protein
MTANETSHPLKRLRAAKASASNARCMSMTMSALRGLKGSTNTTVAGGGIA